MTAIQKSSRIDIIDALRGFALAGIVIVHMVENYVAAPVPEAAVEAAHQGVFDYVIDGIVLILLRGKFFALFSFLFGLSFFIQMHKAPQKKGDYRYRFLWRMILLMCIGYLHSLFYRGDILTIYAMLGVFLLFFYRVRSTWILAIVAILFLGAGRFITFTLTNGQSLFLLGELTAENPLMIQYYDVLKEGSIWEVFQTNAWEGHLMKLDFQLGIFSRAYLTFGFFLLGLYTGRIEFFKNFTQRKKITRDLLWASLILFCVGVFITVGSFAQIGPEPKFDNWYAMIGLTGFDLVNIAITLALLCLFVIVYRSERWRKYLDIFKAYGRTALSNYVLQSILGTFFFYGWGLGFIGTLSNTYVFIAALLLIVFQMGISIWWMKRFYYGPLEWIWRSFTYFTVYPFRRNGA
ncbi:uncharacterized protein SAMN06265375_103406 [Muriicola jejuensis]|uniref:DUF418 domain-containing protein n=1 Tax=Muriicola jejuensis TaxID=504488 RepID=A0A6P0UJK8_9FLAO|nr:DUF418 domain-containing protein [Muriicola jejuensis]NER11243.1 DUF418 domain-containing protein [Muriicola jejuensis]SMP21847.1 uncharacterized protein SAMN06265375_103406 [Muriicola jejuensis]